MVSRWDLPDKDEASGRSAWLRKSQPTSQLHQVLVPASLSPTQSSTNLIPAVQGIKQHLYPAQSVVHQEKPQRQDLKPAQQIVDTTSHTEYLFDTTKLSDAKNLSDTQYHGEPESTAHAIQQLKSSASIRPLPGIPSSDAKVVSICLSTVLSPAKPSPGTSSTLSVESMSDGTQDPVSDVHPRNGQDTKPSQDETLATLVSESEPDVCLVSCPNIYGPIQRPGSASALGSAYTAPSDEDFSMIGSPGTPEDTTNIQIWEDGSVDSRIHSISETDQLEAKIKHEPEVMTAIAPIFVPHSRPAVQTESTKLEERLCPGALQPFRPSQRVLQSMGLAEARRPQVPQYLSDCSQNYQGDITIASNRSADIPDSQNCAVWIMGLPANVTHKELLGAIRGVGQIYATVINSPLDRYAFCAAKIVFFERYQAEKLMAKILHEGSFYVMGRQIRNIRWNKIKSARYHNPLHSRVIRITGPREFMNFETFEAFFNGRFTYELEARQEIKCTNPGMGTHEWRFGSLRCQAAWAIAAIERELGDVFTAQWAVDPCSWA